MVIIIIIISLEEACPTVSLSPPNLSPPNHTRNDSKRPEIQRFPRECPQIPEEVCCMHAFKSDSTHTDHNNGYIF